MKKQFMLALAFSALLFFSCSRDHSNSNTPASGSGWHITLFTDSGDDETGDYTGYTFTFGDGGVLTAVKNSVTSTGTWSQSSKFNIDLGVKSDTNKPLGELTDDWKIISVSATEIRLTDDNDASAEFLTFTKN